MILIDQNGPHLKPAVSSNLLTVNVDYATKLLNDECKETKENYFVFNTH